MNEPTAVVEFAFRFVRWRGARTHSHERRPRPPWVDQQDSAGSAVSRTQAPQAVSAKLEQYHRCDGVCVTSALSRHTVAAIRSLLIHLLSTRQIFNDQSRGDAPRSLAVHTCALVRSTVCSSVPTYYPIIPTYPTKICAQ
ncbi:hypothetical protein LSTR_LSTR015595 [Laodelphax striatellus]|uniref:Uncharacterized protein n=1 Tax=Laodelphax striatellus TaxID=195883 RepID=A0A482WVM0_LAOST|nr:hypothetical protein LSTR_LSTR015595 [Laodelphax striatellus]